VDTGLSSRFRKKEEIVTRQIAGETLLVPIYGDLANMERIFALDPVAAFIWEQLDGEKSLKDIRDGVLGAFDVKEKQAETDIFEFIEELLKADLIDQAK
jgi:methyltransferase-like protein